MSTGSGIALAGAWMAAATFGASPNVTGIGAIYALTFAILATLAVVWRK